jgi:hypothetical protein
MNQVTSPIDLVALLEMLGGEKQIVASLLSKFVEELTSDLAASEQAMVDHGAEAYCVSHRRHQRQFACFYAIGGRA